MATTIVMRTGRMAAWLAAPAALAVTAAATVEVGGREFQPRLFEGDLVPTYGQILDVYGPNVTRELLERGILSSPEDGADGIIIDGGNSLSLARKFRLWPSRLRSIEVDGDETTMKIPYQFSEAFSDLDDRAYVEAALADFSRKTGVIRFIRRGDLGDDDRQTMPHVLFTNDSIEPEQHESEVLADIPFWSYVGHHPPDREDGTNAGQPVNLGPGSLFLPEVVQHVVMHALGIWHTSNRPDRDDFVTVLWDGVADGLEIDFQRRLEDDETELGLPYDYASIMHYATADLSADGESATLDAPEPIGHYENGLSDGDLIHVRLLYQCASGPRGYQEYLSDPCTADCRCWEGSPHGCGGDDGLCQGGLVCHEETDRCVRAASSRADTDDGSGQSGRQPPQNTALWAFSGGCGLLFYEIVILPCLGRLFKRRGYMAIDAA